MRRNKEMHPGHQTGQGSGLILSDSKASALDLYRIILDSSGDTVLAPSLEGRSKVHESYRLGPTT